MVVPAPLPICWVPSAPQHLTLELSSSAQLCQRPSSTLTAVRPVPRLGQIIPGVDCTWFALPVPSHPLPQHVILPFSNKPHPEYLPKATSVAGVRSVEELNDSRFVLASSATCSQTMRITWTPAGYTSVIQYCTSMVVSNVNSNSVPTCR